MVSMAKKDNSGKGDWSNLPKRPEECCAQIGPVPFSAPKNNRGVSKIARWRWWIQAGFLLAWLDPLMMRMHTVCGPVFHCYSCPLATFACPIGVLANFSALHVFPFAALGTLLLVGAVFGSFVCGWACPFGFLQDLIDRVPTRKFTLPSWLGGIRYVVLVGLVMAVPYLWGEAHPLFICRLCPAGALEATVPNVIHTAISGPAIVWPTATKLAILILFVVAMLFTWRPWCTVLCPLGAIYALLNRSSILLLRFRQDRCLDCKLCRSLCHGGGKPERRVDSMQCVRCLECTNCRAVNVETVFQPLNQHQNPIAENLSKG
jgi:ferredoxin-type protein NapH